MLMPLPVRAASSSLSVFFFGADAALDEDFEADEDDERLPPRAASLAVENATSSVAIRKWVGVFMASRESVQELEG